MNGLMLFKLPKLTKTQTMNKIILLSIGMLAVTSCSEAQKPVDRSTTASQTISKVVSAEEFKAKMGKKDVQVIDVRTPEEYKGGKIGNAKNMDFYSDDFKKMISTLDKSKPTLVYCASGGRSGKTAKMMESLGFKEVYDLRGGYNAWPGN